MFRIQILLLLYGDTTIGFQGLNAITEWPFV